jgi:tRNA 2-thiouridine synthesizing protein E
MNQMSAENIQPGHHISGADFPFSPEGWTPDTAETIASHEGLVLNEEHLDVIRALQEYFSTNDTPTFHGRALHDALEESFHSRGGLKYLYELLPGGPVAQGCRLAGLVQPASSENRGFGSVM